MKSTAVLKTCVLMTFAALQGGCSSIQDQPNAQKNFGQALKTAIESQKINPPATSKDPSIPYIEVQNSLMNQQKQSANSSTSSQNKSQMGLMGK